MTLKMPSNSVFVSPQFKHIHYYPNEQGNVEIVIRIKNGELGFYVQTVTTIKSNQALRWTTKGHIISEMLKSPTPNFQQIFRKLNFDLHAKRCQNCYSAKRQDGKKKMYTCKGCNHKKCNNKSNFYCSKKCQKIVWKKSHRFQCDKMT